MRLLVLYLILIVFSLNLYGQSKELDSIKQVVRTTKVDTVKIKALNALGWGLMYQNQDTAIQLGYASLKLAQKTGLEKFIGKSYSSLGVYYWMKGLLDSALIFNDSAFAVFRKINNVDGIASTLGNKASIYSYRGDFYKSLDLYMASWKIVSALGNKKSMCSIAGNLASIYIKLGNYPKAFELYSKALQLAEELGDKRSIALWTGSIGSLYQYTKEYDKALEYYNKALALHTAENNKMDIARELGNIGLVYNAQKQFDKAINSFNRAIDIRKEMTDTRGMASLIHYLGVSYLELNQYKKALEYFNKVIELSLQFGYVDQKASAYQNIGVIYFKQKKMKPAEEFMQKALNIQKEMGDLNAMKNSYSSLTDLYAKSGQWEKAFNYFKLFNKTNDSLFSTEKSKELGKQEASAEYNRLRAVTNAEHKKELEKKEAVAKIEKERQQIWFVLMLCVTIAIAIIALIIFSSLKLTKKQKQIIQLQKNDVEQKNKEILDSIAYAKRLQDAILVPESVLKNRFSDAFVLYKPKDIVAGDFYWMHALNNNRVLIAAADCTGHGVPGAMVSIVCSNALTRSVVEFNQQSPGEILDKTRELVLDTFSKNNPDVKDGMDISLCLINTSNGELEWSGANNPLIYATGGKLHQLKPDKQPVGNYINPKPFTTHKLTLHKNDIIYLYTDGYADQFGGPSGKKFKYKKLNESLQKLCGLGCKLQREELEKNLIEWQGNLEQIDDICILGIKL